VKMQQVSTNCFAVLNEKNACAMPTPASSNRAGGVVIDTQSDLAHARQMINMFSKVWPAMPKAGHQHHEDADHVWGNQLFESAEIIAHRSGARADEARAPIQRRVRAAARVGRLLTRL